MVRLPFREQISSLLLLFNMKSTFLGYLLLLSGLLVLGGCSRSENHAPAVVEAKEPAAGAVKAAMTLPVLGAAPDFKLRTLDGAEVSLASLRGKIVVLDFWATWCPPCVAEVPGYVKMQEKYREQGLAIVGVSVDRDASAVPPFLKKRGVNYQVGIDDGSLADQFGGIEAIPTTFLIDREGRIRHRKVGGMETEEYEQLVRSLL